MFISEKVAKLITDDVSKKNEAVEVFERQLIENGILYTRELDFHHERGWRFDFAIEMHNLAIEIEGGVWTQGRHTRPKGFIGDIEKYNEAAILGWVLLRGTSEQAKNGTLLKLVMRVINEGENYE